MKKLHSYSSLVFITILWGISFPIMDRTLPYLPPFTFVAIRYLLSAVLMTIIFWNKIIKLNLLHIRSAIFIGLPFAHAVIGQLVGLNHTSTTNSAFLTSLTVIVVPIIIWIVERKVPAKSTAIGIFLSLIGVSIMTLQGQWKINIGDIIVFIGTLGFSGQIYILGKIGKEIDPILITILQLYIVGFCALPLALSFETYGYVMNSRLILNLFFIIIVCTVVALTIQNKVQPYISSSHVGIIFLLEPVVAMLTAFLMGDKISSSQLIGSILIIISMIIIILPTYDNRLNRLTNVES